ncbi:IS110 family transposase [Persicimonas caeni]|uniref:IS110 family transposase n=1 Tax=Persicimonas caeni TaxID=2292766 RepID=A0A4Y6PVQ4_PERCE|nr:transposase [Persicimonas caeni]QDG49510.1 IS110 family transposase [Persicimonas caeni]QDG52441.1 IS110 family transposase [Persicimonas caeni]QDG52602.1 IS110 family transposase [Persicimonas caeni]QDG54762.1 IS110 family transposase [Persicimonas caeni]QED30731.1 IS110 family transposase [Persicimonas caeni]
MSTMYVGADIHKSTSTVVVKDEQGRTVSKWVGHTSAENLSTQVMAIPGTVHMTFEESPYAAWMWDTLHPLVDKLVVCDPRRNKLIAEDDKSDEIDAETLADLLRGGFLKPVYHGSHSSRDIRHLVKSYQQVISDRVRIKNRLCGLFDGYGVRTNAKERYTCDQKARETLLKKLPGRGIQQRGRRLYVQLDLLDELVDEALRDMIAEARRFDAFEWIKSIPGFGDKRAAATIGWVRTPHRFRGKRQFFKYVGLAVVHRSTSDWRQGAKGLERKNNGQTMGLNNKYSRPLKDIIKGAAVTAATTDPAWGAHEAALIDDGMDREIARLTIARKLASILLSIWKRGEHYNAEKTVLRGS